MLLFRGVFIRTRHRSSRSQLLFSPLPYGVSVPAPSSQSHSGAHFYGRYAGDASPARTSSPAFGHPITTPDAQRRPARQRSMVIVPRVLPNEVFVYGRPFVERGIDALSRSAEPRFVRDEPPTTALPKLKRSYHPERASLRRRFVE